MNSMLCLRFVFLTLASALLYSCSPEMNETDLVPDTAADIAALELIIQESVTNWNGANLDALMEDNADEFVMMGPDEPAKRGKERLKAEWAAYHSEHSENWQPVIEDIQVSGDLGFVRSSFTTTTTSKVDGTVTVTKGKTIVILKRQTDGSWKHIVEIWNRDAPDDKQSEILSTSP